jgi:TetR/AcrR family transcriptional repressor of nem operon
MKKEETRDALIEAGLELFRSTGYTATGINQILRTANVQSFYSHFPSKEHLVLEVIQLYARGVQERIERTWADSNLSPLGKLREYFEEMIATNGRSRGPIRGCLLGNLSLEVAGQNSEIRDRLLRSFNDWQNAIAVTIRKAIDKGELPRTAEANSLAAIIVDSWEGAQVRAKVEQNDKALELFFDSTFNVLLKYPRL